MILVATILMVIERYSISGYQCLLMVIILMAIGEYFIGEF
jgi:hypothetical protein